MAVTDRPKRAQTYRHAFARAPLPRHATQANANAATIAPQRASQRGNLASSARHCQLACAPPPPAAARRPSTAGREVRWPHAVDSQRCTAPDAGRDALGARSTLILQRRHRERRRRRGDGGRSRRQQVRSAGGAMRARDCRGGGFQRPQRGFVSVP